MKVVLFGPSGAGKTSFVKAVGETRILNTDRGGTTVALDFTVTYVNGVKISLFGTPGRPHFKIIRDILLEGSDGIIFLIDAADPRKDGEAQKMLEDLRKIDPTIPILICANKMDLPNARSVAQIKNDLKLPKNTPVMDLSVRTGKNVKKALKGILLLILVRILPFMEALLKYNEKNGGLDNAIRDLKSKYTNVFAALNYYERRDAITIDWRNRMFVINPRLVEMIKTLSGIT